MNNIARFGETMFTGIKNVADYGFQWIVYGVTLGHAEYPRFKGSAVHQNQIVPTVIRLDQREADKGDKVAAAPVNPKIEAGEKFIKSLQDEKTAAEFRASAEYRAFIADSNPFSSINPSYQEFNAKTFLSTLTEEASNDFKESEEYQAFLKLDPSNPFSEKIETSYKNYLDRITTELKERLGELNRDVDLFIDNEKDLQEKKVLHSFRESKGYKELIERFSKDLKFTLILSDIKAKYKEYKEFGLAEENAKLLDSFGDENKNKFLKSKEYDLLTFNREFIIVPMDIQGAYKNYQDRLTLEKEFRAYMKELKEDVEKFPLLEESPQYIEVAKKVTANLNPESFNLLKNAVQVFERENFQKTIPLQHKDFLESEGYQEILKNPFSNIDDIQKAYKAYVENRRAAEEEKINAYLAQISSDKNYEEFANLPALTAIWANPERTKEDVEKAFKDFKASKSWGFPRLW